MVEVRGGKPGKGVWLYARKMEDDAIKCALCSETMDAPLEMIRKPALMRWSIEQCFKECKEHLGMDHCETRSWTGFRRHMLFTLISQFFIAKLQRRFTTPVNYPSPTPDVIVPVKRSGRRKAVIQFEAGQEIGHPNISSLPHGPQQIMTLSMAKKLIQPFLPKRGLAIGAVMHMLESNAQSFKSFCNAKNEEIMAGGRKKC